MDLGKDTFKWFGFIIQLIRLFITWFGDDNDKEQLDSNGINSNNH